MTMRRKLRTVFITVPLPSLQTCPHEAPTLGLKHQVAPKIPIDIHAAILSFALGNQ